MKILNISDWICRNGRDFCWNVKNYKAKSTHRRWNRVIVRIFDIHNQALAQFKQSFISKKTSGNVHMLWLMQNTHKIPTIWSVFRFVSDFFAPRSIIWHQSLMHNDLNYNLPLHLNRLDFFCFGHISGGFFLSKSWPHVNCLQVNESDSCIFQLHEKCKSFHTRGGVQVLTRNARRWRNQTAREKKAATQFEWLRYHNWFV